MNSNFFKTELINFRSKLDFFIDLYLDGRLPQTILLTGDKDIGKIEFSYHLINFILSQNEDTKYNTNSYKINPNSKTFRLLSENLHQNFFLITPKEKKKIIEISQIKDLKNFLNKSSFNTLPKIVLINESETLNLSSSNALLKLLEECYNNVFFILIHDINKSLLSTIKSRCVLFKFFLKSDEKQKKINDILDNQYEMLSSDFKNENLSPLFFRDLQNYYKKNNLELEKTDLNALLLNIFSKKDFKKNEFVYNHFFLLIQLFIYKSIKYNFDNETYFSLLRYLTKRFEDVNKYNLDFESFVLEFKYLIFNEK